jgi:hypothetical protein
MALRVFVAILSLLINVTTFASLSLAADLPQTLKCNDDLVAICLDDVSGDVTNGIKKCHSDNPRDNNKYLECRDGWREYYKILREDCYESFCHPVAKPWRLNPS